MKKVLLVLAASFSLLSFTAFAGGDCNYYGHDAEIAKADPAVTVTEEVDQTLLALMKKQQAKTDKLVPITTFN